MSDLPIALLNCAIITSTGKFEVRDISVDEFKALIATRPFKSYIGHVGTAEVLSEMLGQSVPMNREAFKQQVGQLAVALTLKGRAPEGSIFDYEMVQKIGYELKTIQLQE